MLLVYNNLNAILKTDLTSCDDCSTVLEALENLILRTHTASENDLCV